MVNKTGKRFLIAGLGLMINTINNTGKLKPKTKAILNSINEKDSLAALASKEIKLKLKMIANKENITRRAAL